MLMLQSRAFPVAFPPDGMTEQISLESLGPVRRNHPIFKAVPKPIEGMVGRFEKPIFGKELVRGRADRILAEVAGEEFIASLGRGLQIDLQGVQTTPDKRDGPRRSRVLQRRTGLHRRDPGARRSRHL